MTTRTTPMLYCIKGGHAVARLDRPSAKSTSSSADGTLFSLSSDAIAALSDIRFAVKQFENQAAAVEVLRTTAGILASMAVEPERDED